MPRYTVCVCAYTLAGVSYVCVCNIRALLSCWNARACGFCVEIAILFARFTENNNRDARARASLDRSNARHVHDCNFPAAENSVSIFDLSYDDDDKRARPFHIIKTLVEYA